jgi:acetyl-CoA acyltransferase
VGIPAHTVAQACISSNVGIATAAEKIMSGQCDTILVGGVETFSDVPIRLTRPMRQVGSSLVLSCLGEVER